MTAFYQLIYPYLHLEMQRHINGVMKMAPRAAGLPIYGLMGMVMFNRIEWKHFAEFDLFIITLC